MPLLVDLDQPGIPPDSGPGHRANGDQGLSQTFWEVQPWSRHLHTAGHATSVGELIEALEEIDPETPLSHLGTRPIAGVWITVTTPARHPEQVQEDN